MRALRWKRQYLTGDAATDARNQALAGILLETAVRMRSKEHCQDMNEMHDDLVTLAERRFDGAPEDDPTARASDVEIRDFLAERMPLPARGTAACRDCGICEWAEARIMDWLEDATECERSPVPRDKTVAGQ
ncbi:MAG: hypothetical protein PHQ14_05015 [Chromatiales bacterium]|jgi:hypothetical protein|nr:hypothetical protein [Chromatiales bacterium]